MSPSICLLYDATMNTLEAQVYVTQMSLMQLCCMGIGELNPLAVVLL
jgi:hypothetical protein